MNRLTTHGVNSLVKLLTLNKDKLGLADNFARSHLDLDASNAATAVTAHQNISSVVRKSGAGPGSQQAIPAATVVREYLYVPVSP